MGRQIAAPFFFTGSFMRVEAIIPAYNEELSISRVVRAIPPGAVQRIVVVDNSSTDRTAEEARNAGADVVREERRGYGSACLRGVAETQTADILVFLDGDFSDDPAILPHLIQPILDGAADLVIGSRVLGHREPGSLPPHARLGNTLACFLVRWLFGVRFTDLGPFRAIRRSSLESLRLRDINYGWTVEMQAKAAIAGLRCVEVAAPYRKRIGRSKISGTISGSFKAGAKILLTIFRLFFHKIFSSNQSTRIEKR
jgi:glycosyltransferase involved in cell wall biosynthesis